MELDAVYEIYEPEEIPEEEEKTILVLGGNQEGWNAIKMQILSSDRSIWKTPLLRLPRVLFHGGCVLLNGEIFVFGGLGLWNKVFKLNVVKMDWIQMADMNEDRAFISGSSVVFDGCIWVLGGSNCNSLNTVEKYCPTKGEWTLAPEMIEARNRAAAVVCSNKIFVCGGHNGRIHLQCVEFFDPMGQVWTMLRDMPEPRQGHSMISDGISFMIIGGEDGEGRLASVWSYTPDEWNPNWKELPPKKFMATEFTAELLGTEVISVGGRNGDGSRALVELFDGEFWADGPRLPNACYGMTSVIIPRSLGDIIMAYAPNKAF